MELSLITKAQKEQKDILVRFYEKYNNVEMDFPDVSLTELFVKAAKVYPKKIAVSNGSYEMNYEKLNILSDKVAFYLNNKGVKKGDLVYIDATRSIDTIVGILGILKVGAAYVPVDPEFPEGRKEYIKTHSKCTFELYTDMYEDIYKTIGGNALEYSKEWSSDALAYVIYTSGSTGQPKGVAVTHKEAVNTILDIDSKFHINENDKIIGISSLSFDLSVYDIFGALSTGAELVQIETQKDLNALKRVIKEKQITVWNSVPTLMEKFVNEINGEYINSLKVILLSGDWIPLSLPDKIKHKFNNAKIVSLGGATEAAIWSIYYEIEKVNAQWKSIPYGKPLSNQKIYILNFQQTLCPIGVQGEIYIGGKSVAEGYCNDDEKTKASFIIHPQFGRLYKTGDFGVMHKESYIEFLGRKDDQVKVNGYRVELGEIEFCLEKDESVKKAIVVNDFTGENDVIRAYILPETVLRTSDYYRKFAMKYLPDYMIPSSFTEIDHIPLNINGKIDKNKLLSEDNTSDKNVYEEPKGVMENEIAKLIEDELKNGEKISRKESLYNIGLNSIMMMSIINKLQNKYGIKIVFRDFMKINNLIDLTEYIKLLQDTSNNMENYHLEEDDNINSNTNNEYKENFGKRVSDNKDHKYFWNPTLQWKIKDGKVLIGKKYYKELSPGLFPQLYFMLQDGISKEELDKYLVQFDKDLAAKVLELLVSQKIIVNELMSPAEIFSTQENLFSHNYGEYLICDQVAYEAFKKEQLNRSIYDGEYKEFNYEDDYLKLSRRRSIRKFSKKAIDFETIGKVLSVLRQVQAYGMKHYYYPSSGGFYAIDLYLYVKKDGVEGLNHGIYYYNPIKNGIIKISNESITENSYYFKNKDIFRSSSVTFFFVYNAKVNMPNYGYMGYYYACLDAGIMIELLTNALEYWNVGSCSIGDFNTEEITKILKLDSNEILLHIMEIGNKCNNTDYIQNIDTQKRY